MLDEAKLKSVIAAVLEVDEDTINENTSMDNVETWDSIKHMDLILTIEEEFDVSVPDEEAADLTSYRLIKLVLGDLLKSKI